MWLYNKIQGVKIKKPNKAGKKMQQKLMRIKKD